MVDLCDACGAGFASITFDERSFFQIWDARGFFSKKKMTKYVRERIISALELKIMKKKEIVETDRSSDCATLRMMIMSLFSLIAIELRLRF